MLMSALEKLIEASGISARRFARLVLAGRNERTVRRWLEGGAPPEVDEWLREDVVRLERRGHMLHLQIFAPIDPKLDRRAAGSGD